MLGTCGCCGEGCAPVTNNCNFVLRRFDVSNTSEIVWIPEATEEDKACVQNNNCLTALDVCTGEGVVYKNSGGGGGGGGGGGASCPLATDEGPILVTVPCCSQEQDLYTCNPTVYQTYDQTIQELYSGTFTYLGISYTVSAGNLIQPEQPLQTPAAFSEPASTPAAVAAASAIGTFNVPYEDESIDFDNIVNLELTDLEKEQKLCKFSYKFKFTPSENYTYFIIALPCDPMVAHPTVNLAEDGTGVFYAQYSSTDKSCIVNP